jgi:hypothetical protein
LGSPRKSRNMKTIWIHIHGLGAGWTSPTGNEWVATPNLDRIAAEGTTFDQFHLDQPDPILTWESFRKKAVWPNDLLPDRLAQLRKSGTRTFLLRESRTPAPTWMKDCFEEVIEVEMGGMPDCVAEVVMQFAAIENGLLIIESDQLLPPWIVDEELFNEYFDLIGPDPIELTPEEVSAQVLHLSREASKEEQLADEENDDIEDEELEEEETEEVEPEHPLLPPWDEPVEGFLDPKDDERWAKLHATFGAAVNQFDEELGIWMEWFTKAKLDQTADWLITSSCGLPLGEHGNFGLNDSQLFEERVHGVAFHRPRGGAIRSHHDPLLYQPADLFPILEGKPPTPRSMILSRHEDELILRTADWAIRLQQQLIEGQHAWKTQLFLKPEDRWEVNDVSSKQVEWTEYLRSILLQIHEMKSIDSLPGLKSFELIQQEAQPEENEDANREVD